MYYTKTGANTWEMSVFDRAAAAPGGGFPYTGGAITTANLTFSATTGELTSAGSISFTVPNGGSLALDISQTTQLAGDYAITFRANSTGSGQTASDSVDIRTTVQTSPIWGFVGIGIIVLVVVGLFLVFRQYGRR